MPCGFPDGAQPLFRTYFDEMPTGPEWEIYDSVGNANWGIRDPNAISIVNDPTASNGTALKITADMQGGVLHSGGLKLKTVAQTYGKYTARIRVDADPSQSTSGVALLWPESNDWPRDGEIDYFEGFNNRDTRAPHEAYVHYNCGTVAVPADCFVGGAHPDGANMTQWHVYTLEWTATSISVAVDGGTPHVVTSNPMEIPDWNMEPTFQLDAWDSPLNPGVQPVLTQDVCMFVDFLVVEAA